MVSWLQIISIVFPIFALIGLGYLAGRLKIVTGGTADALSNFVYYFALPALLFISVAETPLSGYADFNFIVAYSAAHIALAVVMWLGAKVFKLKRGVVGMVVLTTMFGNVAYMGIPFNTATFGPVSQPITALTIALTLTLTTFWSLSIGQGMVFATKRGRSLHAWRWMRLLAKKLVTNPFILAVAAGVIYSAINFPLPEPISKTFQLLGNTAGPAALFALGLFFVAHKIKAKLGTIAALTVAKLLVFPVITYLLFQFLPTDPLKVSIAIMQTAMPLAATNFIFAEKLKIEPDLVASTILVSTVVSIITLSALLFILT